MAANKEKGAKHLTSLTLDISGIKQSLDEAQQMIEKKSVELGKTAAAGIQRGVSGKQINEDSLGLGKIEQKAGQIASAYQNVGRVISAEVTAINGEAVKYSTTFEESAGKIIKAQNNISKSGIVTIETTKENFAKREEAEARAYQSRINELAKQRTYEEQIEKERVQAAQDHFNKINGVNQAQQRSKQELFNMTSRLVKAESQMQESARQEFDKRKKAEAQAYRSQINELAKQRAYEKQIEDERAHAAQEHFNKINGVNQGYHRSQKELFDMTDRLTKAEAQREAAQVRMYNQSIKGIDGLISKQKQFTSLVESKKSTSINRSIIRDSKALEASLESAKAQLVKFGRVTPEVQAQIEKLGIAQKELGTRFETTGNQSNSFLKVITDKAKWLGAFYIVNSFIKALRGIKSTLQETEDAVVQLQRVLKEDIGQSALSEELYKIAYNYGRSFKDVQEVAVKFAQTGASWNDSLKLTESAMLALNTAELDVQQSTEGLIAIMSQWDVPAEKMRDVIDKINITADRFPVTSEKIIAALQRTSSSARNANMSLEDTIGAITALSKATGRSGEQIGTALNSLIIYTSKPKALDAFYEVGNNSVKKTIEAYRSGSATILEIWQALAKNMESLSKEQQDILADKINIKELSKHLEDEAQGITEDLRKVYGSVGTHRQNWFVGLLNEIDKVNEATDNMMESIGYSVEENEKYMSTFTAMVQQLGSLWKSLIVDVGQGNTGIMGFMKILTGAGIAVGEVIKAFGGLNSVLMLVVGNLIRLKAAKITTTVLNPILERFAFFRLSVQTFSSAFYDASLEGKNFFGAMRAGKAAVDGINTSTKGFVATLGALQMAIGVVMMAYGLVNSAVIKFQETKRQEREQIIESSKAMLDNSDETKKLYEKYEKLKSVSNKTKEEQSEFNRVIYKLAQAMRIETEDAHGAAKSFDSLAKSIDDAKEAAYGLTELEWDAYLGSLYENLEKVGKSGGLSDLFNEDIYVDAVKFAEASKNVRSELSELMRTYYTPGKMGAYYAPDDDQKDEFYESLYQAKELLESLEAPTKKDKELFKEISSTMQLLESDYVALRQASILHWVTENQGAVESVKTLEQFDEVVKSMMKDLNVDEGAIGLIKDLADDFFPNLGESIEEVSSSLESFKLTEDELKELEKSFNALNSEIDTSQNAFDGARDAVEEYNQNGYMTVDTIQKITKGGYDFVKALDFQRDGIHLTDDATADLINSQKQNVLESIKQAAAMDALQFTEAYLNQQTNEGTTANENLKSALSGTKAEMAEVITASIGLANGYNVAAQQAALLAKAEAPENFDSSAFQKALSERLQPWSEYFRYVENGIGDIAQYSKHEAKAREDAIKEAQRAAKKELDNQKKAINEKYKEEKDRLNEQKEAVKDRYKAEIDALKDVQEENSRKDKQEEYIKRKNEAEKNMQKASTRSGIEYREQEAEAREKLEDIQTDWEKVLRDWQTEDRIEALEKLRDAEITNIELRMKALEKQKDAAVKGIEAQTQALEAQKSVATSTYSGMSKSYKDDYLKPKAKAEKEYNDLSYESALKEHQSQMNKMKSASELNASAVYNAYRNNFILPFSRDLGGISNQISAMGMTLPFSPFGFFNAPVAPRVPESTNYNYNTTKNSTTFANFYGEGAARGASRSIYNMP